MKEYLPMIIQTFILIVTGIVAFYKLHKKVDILVNDTKYMREKSDKNETTISDIENHIKLIDNYISSLSSFFKDKKDEFGKSIYGSLTKYDILYTANSPLRLTEKGNNFIIDSGFDKIVEKYRGSLIDEIKRQVEDKEKGKKLYYIEKESIHLIRNLDKEDDPIMENIGLYIFKNGLLDIKSQILNTLGIYLRDKVAEELGLKEKLNKLFEKDNRTYNEKIKDLEIKD